MIDRKVGFIAADRRHTANEWNSIQDGVCKIRVAEIYGETHYLGSSGYESTALIAEDWYIHGNPNSQPDPIDCSEDTNFTTLILTPDAQILELDRYLRPSTIPHRFAAAGSGGGFAMAILEAGCGIEKAMRTAIRMDGASGFPFDVFYLSGHHEVFDVE